MSDGMTLEEAKRYFQNITAFAGERDKKACEIAILAIAALKAEPIIHCKDCKYFEYDSVSEVDGVPLIVAHEICKKWADGCKTREDGFCFMAERRENMNNMNSEEAINLLEDLFGDYGNKDYNAAIGYALSAIRERDSLRATIAAVRKELEAANNAIREWRRKGGAKR